MSNKTTGTEKFLDELALNIFGRSRSLAQAGNSCVKCGQPATEFKDELSRKEYGITGFCQKCQDSVFGGDDE
jgi:hypothetical protein